MKSCTIWSRLITAGWFSEHELGLLNKQSTSRKSGLIAPNPNPHILFVPHSYESKFLQLSCQSSHLSPWGVQATIQEWNSIAQPYEQLVWSIGILRHYEQRWRRYFLDLLSSHQVISPFESNRGPYRRCSFRLSPNPFLGNPGRFPLLVSSTEPMLPQAAGV